MCLLSQVITVSEPRYTTDWLVFPYVQSLKISRQDMSRVLYFHGNRPQTGVIMYRVEELFGNDLAKHPVR